MSKIYKLTAHYFRENRQAEFKKDLTKLLKNKKLKEYLKTVDNELLKDIILTEFSHFMF